MIEMRLWRAFVAVAEELNFRRAAQRLKISQPGLTKQIQELEARLDMELFRREPRGIVPTEPTLACLDDVRAFLERAQALEGQFTAARRSAATPIRLGMLEFFSRAYLPGVLQQARQSFPEARISVVEMNTYETAAAVADGAIDLGLSRSPVTEQDVIAQPFRRGRWVLIMPAGHRLAEKEELELADLGGDPLIFFSRRLNPELFDEVMGAIEAAGARPEIAYQAQDPVIGIELAAGGVGLCLAVSYVVHELPDGLVARPVRGFTDPTLDLVWRRDRVTPVLRLVIDALQTHR